jgi:hypothetical protein
MPKLNENPNSIIGGKRTLNTNELTLMELSDDFVKETIWKEQ